MMPAGPCACNHAADSHHRGEDGVERCHVVLAGILCACDAYVPAVTAPLCVCGHMPTMHQLRNRTCRFEKICGCTNYRAVQNVPFSQLRELAWGCQTVVVVVPVEAKEGEVTTNYADYIAGDLSQTATLVLVQDGPQLYFVAKHPEREKVGAVLMTEDSLRQTLLRMKRHLGEGHKAAFAEGTDLGGLSGET